MNDNLSIVPNPSLPEGFKLKPNLISVIDCSRSMARAGEVFVSCYNKMLLGVQQNSPVEKVTRYGINSRPFLIEDQVPVAEAKPFIKEQFIDGHRYSLLRSGSQLNDGLMAGLATVTLLKGNATLVLFADGLEIDSKLKASEVKRWIDAYRSWSLQPWFVAFIRRKYEARSISWAKSVGFLEPEIITASFEESRERGDSINRAFETFGRRSGIFRIEEKGE